MPYVPVLLSFLGYVWGLVYGGHCAAAGMGAGLEHAYEGGDGTG